MEREHTVQVGPLVVPESDEFENWMKGVFKVLVARSAQRCIPIATVVKEAANVLMEMARSEVVTKAAASGTLQNASTSDAIVPAATFYESIIKNGGITSADICGKLMFCYFVQELGLEQFGITATVCKKLHQGDQTDNSHDDAKLFCRTTNKELDINCKTVRRNSLHSDSPSYQVKCAGGCDKVGAYFVVCWKKGVNGFPQVGSVDQVLTSVSALVLIASADLDADRKQDDFRIHCNKLSFTAKSQSVTKKVRGKHKRNGFATLHVLALLRDDHGFGLDDKTNSRNNICEYFGIQQLPVQEP